MTRPKENRGLKKTVGGGGMAGGTIPSGQEPTSGRDEPIRVPLDDQDRLPTEENASEENPGGGKMATRHDALEGEGGMLPPGWTED